MPRNLKTSYFAFKDGLDLQTPPLSMPPGRLLGAQNYEIALQGGYSRIEGFERFSGKDKPSDASYWILGFDAGDTEVSEGDTITGGTSGATAVALIDGILDSGSYAGSDAAGSLVVYALTGTFQDNEDLEVSGSPVASMDGTASEKSADTLTLHNTYIQDAIETTRALIAAVPGSGAIRGVWLFAGVTYAFRDNSGATAVDMYKSTTSGWSKCDLGFTIDFDAGTTAFTVDDTLTGGTSSATGTIKKVVVESGDWTTNDAEGYIVLYSQSGTFQDDETITDGSGGSATADGIGSDNAFSAGGSFELVNYNFTGHSATQKMYGINGADKAFEWDGSTFSWIPTGMTTDVPIHINAFQNHLFLFFTGGSVQHSSIWDPGNWSVVMGASQLGTGDEITGSLVLPGPALVIFCRNSTFILKGSSSSDWEMVTHSFNSGAISGSAQLVQDGIYLDDRGLTKLSNVQDYGDFKDNTISELVQSRFDAKKESVSCSTIVRRKNQYILFFTDNTALCCTFKNRKVIGFMPFDYGMPVRHIVSGEDSNGNEAIFFGSDDGYIYEMNKGTSFDGESISAFLRTAYNHLGSPRYYKKFRQVFLEMDPSTDPNIELQFAPDFSYSDPDIPTHAPVDYTLEGGGGFWGSATWGSFYWGGQGIATLEGYIDGHGVNISLLINSNATYERPHTISGAIIHYSMRGIKR